MLLQVVSDGTIGLDDPALAHAPDLTIADGVTIRQLLAHRSGIPEHTDGELAPAVLADPERTWTPADVIGLVAAQPRDFRCRVSTPAASPTERSRPLPAPPAR